MSARNAADYLPHESPMVLLGCVIDVTEDTALCSVVVSESSVLGGRAIKCDVPEFAAGSELLISVSMVLRDEKLASFEGVISIKQEEDNLQVAKGRLNTYQPDKDELTMLTQGKQE